MPSEQSYVEVQLTHGKVALIDAEDLERVSQYRWHAHKYKTELSWYAQTNLRGPDGKLHTLGMHRFIMGIGIGDKRRIDHIDCYATLDNRKANLRFATDRQNAMNRRKPRTNTSGTKNVHFHKSSRKWQVLIRVNGRDIHIGSFSCRMEADLVADSARRVYFGPFARSA